MSKADSKTPMVKNAVGRMVPALINGEEAVPFKGVGKHTPTGTIAPVPKSTSNDFPRDGDKTVADIKTALKNAGIRDGMTISTHHHLRNGDHVANAVFQAAAELGVKNLRWFPSAAFPCHAPMIDLMESGVIHHIEGSMNGPLGAYCSQGKMKGMAVLRSHGGRYQAIKDGEVHIDIAVLAAPTADPCGNATGDRGPAACGLITLGEADSRYADHTIVVTDNLVPFPCVPWQVKGNHVDQVVVMDCIGDPQKIVSGTTQVTKSPDRLLIAELTARFVDEAGIIRDGFSFQAGAGGTSLSFGLYLRDMMRERNIKARFIQGGTTKFLVDMLEDGLADYIIDGQTFDLEAVRSMRENPNHIALTPDECYNWHGKGIFASMIDVIVLGATEVDAHFNANVVTHTDGRLMHGIGGWQNCLFSKCTILPIPSYRNRTPVIVDDVTTLVGPGEMIDVIVTERGIAINPLREDLRAKLRGSNLPIRELADIKAEVEDICGGKPAKPELDEKVVAAIKWVDGTVIDCVRAVKG